MSTTIEINELRAMTAVVTTGTFTAAADTLGTDKAHVSRIVTRLETKLGARLFERSTRRLNVTEIGREVYERATGILQALEETENRVAEAHSIPSGTLKLTAGPEYGVLQVNTWIARYLKQYPDVHVEAEYTNRVTDIIHEGFDLAIRVGPLQDSELSARKLGELNYRFYASKDYLRQYPPPSKPEDLHQHALIAFAPRGRPLWQIVSGAETHQVKPVPRFQVNNNQAALGMTIEGLGIALLPTFMAQSALSDGTIGLVLPDWARIPVPIHAVFASSRYMSPKVRAFVDLAIAAFNR